jgi:feruloyl esterase
VVVGKEMTKTFYGRPHTKSYYLGCSTGGRQGFKAVQEFPEDFDGVVAGAPAFSFNNLTSWSGNFFKITGRPEDPTFISASLWNGLIKDHVMKQCDHLDGYKDGILEDTSLCHYDASALECKSVASGNSSCLTKAQVNTVKQIYSPLIQPDGSLVYPRMQPGGGYSPLYGGTPFSITQDWYRYVIYENPQWDPTTLSFADMAYASRLNPSNAETWHGDLSAFKARGSKVIHYHGLEDSLISSENSDRYYEHVRQTMHMTRPQLDDFYRYFRISGTGHCGGGPGASNIGQSGSSVASVAPDANVLTAIIRWVEQGIPPETLMGTKWKGDIAGNGVAFRRRHCRYPKRNHYKSGNASDPQSWQCID